MNSKKFIAIIAVLVSIMLLMEVPKFLLSPLSIYSIISHSDTTEKIFLSDVILKQKGVQTFSLYIQDSTEIKKFYDILDTCKYKRLWSLSGSNPNSANAIIKMTVFYRDKDGKLDNFDLEVRDNGVLVCARKEFKIDERNKDHLFNLLYKSIEERNLHAQVKD